MQVKCEFETKTGAKNAGVVSCDPCYYIMISGVAAARLGCDYVMRHVPIRITTGPETNFFATTVLEWGSSQVYSS